MKKSGLDIPPAELELLGILWQLGSGTVRDVQEALERQHRRLAYTTILTLLGRLEERGYLHARRENQANVYRPRISREEVTANRLSSLVRQLSGGKAMPLILQLVESHRLSAEDVRQLRELLAQMKKEEPKRR